MIFAAFTVGVFAQEKAEVSDYERLLKLETAVRETYQSRGANTAVLAEELLKVASRAEPDWNYANAVHAGNVVLGRIAFEAGDLPEAKRRLLMSVAEDSMPYGLKSKSGTSFPWKASPQMDSFGPDMSLARDLLTKGEKEIVLKYFDLCSKFWVRGKDRLDNWRTQVENGEAPNFGPNLVYIIGQRHS